METSDKTNINNGKKKYIEYVVFVKKLNSDIIIKHYSSYSNIMYEKIQSDFS